MCSHFKVDRAIKLSSPITCLFKLCLRWSPHDCLQAKSARRNSLLFLRSCGSGSGCVGIQGNVSNCHCPKSTVLSTGDSGRYSVPVAMSKAGDVRSTKAVETLFQRGYPRCELTTTLLTPEGVMLWVHDLAYSFAGGTWGSISSQTKSALR